MILSIGDVRKANYPIVDATSVHELCRRRVLRYLMAREKERREIATTPETQLTHAEIKSALGVLERACVHGRIVVDLHALRCFDESSLEHRLPEFISVFESDPDLLNNVCGQVLKQLHFMHNNESFAQLADSEPGDNGDLSYHIQLMKTMRSSAGTWHRALFYLELSSQLGLPVFLSPVKNEWLERFATALDHVAFDLFQEISQIFDQKLWEGVKKSLMPSKQFQGMPLALYFLRFAQTRDCSIYEAFMEISARPSAKLFREQIGELVNLYRSGAEGRLRLNNFLNKLSATAQSWREEAAVGLGVTKNKIAIDLKTLPKVGEVFELFGKAKASAILPDIRLFGKGYLMFITEWYLNDKDVAEFEQDGITKYIADKRRKDLERTDPSSSQPSDGQTPR